MRTNLDFAIGGQQYLIALDVPVEAPALVKMVKPFENLYAVGQQRAGGMPRKAPTHLRADVCNHRLRESMCVHLRAQISEATATHEL